MSMPPEALMLRLPTCLFAAALLVEQHEYDVSLRSGRDFRSLLTKARSCLHDTRVLRASALCSM